MPNWNYTDVRVSGSEKQIDELYNIMIGLKNKDEENIPNDFGRTWYGDLVDALGVDWKTVYCRGSWDDIEKVDANTLQWWDETAWGPLTEVFGIIEDCFPELKVYWRCEEPGMCLYESNDVNHKFFDERFILYYNEDGDYEYFESEEELLAFVNDRIDDYPELESAKSVDSLQQLDNLIEDSENIWCYPVVYKD